jgi:hypothetical protein
MNNRCGRPANARRVNSLIDMCEPGYPAQIKLSPLIPLREPPN